jgi:acetyl-CoA carboxylase carboxyltransferase component
MTIERLLIANRGEISIRIARAAAKPLSIASIFGVDDTIDPAQTRKWLVNLLRSVRAGKARKRKKRPAIDTW